MQGGHVTKIKFELPVIGVKVLKESTRGFEGTTEYRGVSYCDAVRLATFGEELVIGPGSIEVCKWSPVILGLKKPETDFEVGLEPRLEWPVAGIYLAQLSRFGDIEPDVIMVRGVPADLRAMADAVGAAEMQGRYRGQIGRTALGVGGGRLDLKVKLTHGTNRVLARLRDRKWFDAFTRAAFNDPRVTGAFEKLARNTVADMSMCRNSTVLPLLEDAGNISFFCTGGVTWGGNSPANMTSGFPGRLRDAVCDLADWPGKSR